MSKKNSAAMTCRFEIQIATNNDKIAEREGKLGCLLH